MGGRLFGTDGLPPARAGALSAAAARGRRERDRSHRPVAIVGRDPRASGEMLEAAVLAGLTSAGADAVRVGVLPTPAVAHLVAALDADLGVMISASHNAMPDNGIKLFASGGHKLPDALEDAIEAGLPAPGARPTGAAIGRVRDLPDAVARYTEHLVRSAPARLDGIKVVVDCAHGAASGAAPLAYRRAGADGDADRCRAGDATGAEVDGDQIRAVLALAMRDAGELVDRTLVATVMSNLGLHIAMREAGIALKTTQVGDRYVLEELRAGGYSLGGEQSGHVVLPRHATTGDGALTALRLMARMASTGKTLAELTSVVTTLPQILVNVVVADREKVAADASVREAVQAAEAELGDTGRILLRPSGTEQLVRVMVEAPTVERAKSIAGGVAEVVAAVG